MQISAVIPTCNRKARLLFLLDCLNRSEYALEEVIIVDSGEERLSSTDLASFSKLHIKYLSSQRSVCIQRNTGVRAAASPWILLCDDDIEPTPDYLKKLVEHVNQHLQAGAVSGLFLQKEQGKWTATYPVRSSASLLWRYVFKLSIWGEIDCTDNFLTRNLKNFYQKNRNHISKAGWPVITDFSGDYFMTPLYSLGAALIKRDWLIHSAFDEVLDAHGIGEHYGVISGFPSPVIHVLNSAFVYHHREESSRLQRSLQYYRRVLALDYFRQRNLRNVKKHWLLWSLFGNLLMFTFKRDRTMMKASYKSILSIILNNNPYYIGHKTSKKVVQPVFE